MKTNMREGYVLISVMMISILITLSIAGFVKYSSQITMKEFHKDLAKTRGYWAVYGLKELNADSSFTYPYYRLGSSDRLYDIKATKNVNIYSWKIMNDENSSVKNDDIFRRTLYSSDGNKMEKYVYEP